MSPKQIMDECTTLGMQVVQLPGEGRKSFSAFFRSPADLRVYWSTSYEGDPAGYKSKLEPQH